MNKIVDRFDRSYVINLRDRLDRRENVISDFRKRGIDIPNPKVQFFTADRPNERGDFPTLGARGSFTSHREILRLAVRDSLRNVLVFEDDVLFKSISAAAIDRILDALDRTPWDVVYFGYVMPDDKALSGPLTAWKDKTIGGHFYGVNGSFIHKMAVYMTDCEQRPSNHPMGGPTYRDGAYNRIHAVFPGVRVYLAVPNLAEQRSSRTDLHPLKFYDKFVWLRPALEELRILKNHIRLFRMRMK
jgi:hypothetical protein